MPTKAPKHVVRLYVSHTNDGSELMRESPFYVCLTRVAVGAGPVQKRGDGSVMRTTDGRPLRCGKEVVEAKLHDLSADDVAAICAVFGVSVPAPGEYVSGVVGEAPDQADAPRRPLPQVA